MKLTRHLPRGFLVGLALAACGGEPFTAADPNSDASDDAATDTGSDTAFDTNGEGDASQGDATHDSDARDASTQDVAIDTIAVDSADARVCTSNPLNAAFCSNASIQITRPTQFCLTISGNTSATATPVECQCLETYWTCSCYLAHFCGGNGVCGTGPSGSMNVTCQ